MLLAAGGLADCRRRQRPRPLAPITLEVGNAAGRAGRAGGPTSASPSRRARSVPRPPHERRGRPYFALQLVIGRRVMIIMGDAAKPKMPTTLHAPRARRALDVVRQAGERWQQSSTWPSTRSVRFKEGVADRPPQSPTRRRLKLADFCALPDHLAMRLPEDLVSRGLQARARLRGSKLFPSASTSPRPLGIAHQRVHKAPLNSETDEAPPIRSESPRRGGGRRGQGRARNGQTLMDDGGAKIVVARRAQRTCRWSVATPSGTRPASAAMSARKRRAPRFGHGATRRRQSGERRADERIQGRASATMAT